MPIWQRTWFLERVVEEIKKNNGSSKAADPGTRALSGAMRPDGPHRTKRFT